MSVKVVVGAQWGDEGKGKIIDILAEKVDVIARYQGGHNAGHTVVIGNDKFVLHLLPTGILQGNKKCIIGNGVVVNPDALLSEIEGVRKKGVTIDNNLWISKKAHLIMPYHQVFDNMNEKQMGKKKIGTTGRGIGPSYSDKIARAGIRVEDMFDEDLLKEKIDTNLELKNWLLKNYYNQKEFSSEKIFNDLMEFHHRIKDNIVDVSVMLRDCIQKGEDILCEGAQGTMLDIDHGTYPYVTSSSSISAGACTGLGISPRKIDYVLGVTKAYTTRVGDGPFPTELDDSHGDMLRKKGNEFGATTGRSRRCGWFDALLVKYSSWINGFDSIALTKLDVLDNCKKLYICNEYRYKNQIITEMPSELYVLRECKPIYKEFDGWMDDTTKISSFNDLPDNAKIYVDEITKSTGDKISMLSTGQKRDNIIILEEI